MEVLWSSSGNSLELIIFNVTASILNRVCKLKKKFDCLIENSKRLSFQDKDY